MQNQPPGAAAPVVPDKKASRTAIIIGVAMLAIGLVGGFVISRVGSDLSKSMSETTIIALVFFAFIAILTIGSMFAGSEAVTNAIKMLTSLSAIFGVVIGAIPGFYFANKVNKSELEQAQAEKNQSEESKQKAVTAANTAGELASQLANVISHSNSNGKITLPSNKLSEVTNKINQIKEVTNQVTQDAKADAATQPTK